MQTQWRSENNVLKNKIWKIIFILADDLVHQIVFWLNDEELDLDTDDDDDEDFDLDLDDPCIAFQYYDRGDIRRYLAWERLLRGDMDDDSDSEMNMFLC